MKKEFANVRILIWDFDGTLYKHNKDLLHAVREAEYKTIIHHTHWNREEAIAEFEKIYKKVTPSATEVVASLCKIQTKEAAIETEQYFDRTTYLTRDVKLVRLFKKLSPFRHFILANGIARGIVQALAVLGIPRETFEEIVTSEIVNVNKPHEEGFRYILNRTALPPEQHMMIGDREAVDLAPAKKLGMKTCLVWSKKQSTIADVTLATVYNVNNVLL